MVDVFIDGVFGGKINMGQRRGEVEFTHFIECTLWMQRNKSVVHGVIINDINSIE